MNVQDIKTIKLNLNFPPSPITSFSKRVINTEKKAIAISQQNFRNKHILQQIQK